MKRSASPSRLEWPLWLAPLHSPVEVGWRPNKFPQCPSSWELNVASAISIETTVAHKKYRAGEECVKECRAQPGSTAKPLPRPPLYCSAHTQRSLERGSTIRKHLWIPCRTPPMATFHPLLFYKRFHLLQLWPRGMDKWMAAWCGSPALGCVPCTN